MEATVYKNIQQGINLLTINITKWETKNKVVNNTSLFYYENIRK